eukprot:scaffold4410_cov44-Attheya_sp.AAC.6
MITVLSLHANKDAIEFCKPSRFLSFDARVGRPVVLQLTLGFEFLRDLGACFKSRRSLAQDSYATPVLRNQYRLRDADRVLSRRAGRNIVLLKKEA